MTKQLFWSDEVYLMHGYMRGDVVPTLDLILTHKHPDDRQRAKQLWEELLAEGGLLVNYHRLIDARNNERRVLTSAVVLSGEGAGSAPIQGYIVDLTATVQREVEQASAEAVRRASETRGIIDRATGLLMGQLNIDADTAFKLLLTGSSHTNTKLARLSTLLLEAAAPGQASSELAAFVRMLQEFPTRRQTAVTEN
ncbi:PAS and ANTAR domain-containing protein [bacterium RCC_150]